MSTEHQHHDAEYRKRFDRSLRLAEVVSLTRHILDDYRGTDLAKAASHLLETAEAFQTQALTHEHQH